ERARLAALLREVLARPRDPASLRAEVLAMRAEMAAHKPPAGPLDAKLLRGGLVDAEFIVHFLQLRDGTALHPSLERAIAGLIAAGRLPPELAAHHLMLTRLLVAARLLAPDGTRPPPAAMAALAAACGFADEAALMAALAAARRAIAACWAALFDQQLEIDT
ncbi:MAG: glutamine-synthetase adenylyltransferase, partial [Porphyrobacter sp.]|nr:glutamine-synthetase adenylyltransferase [Porphyrobacter sp.]